MRILGFTKKWDKLNNNEFTTWRLPRKDKDWFVGEKVQIVYHPRHKDREPLGYAEIINKEQRIFINHPTIPFPTDQDAHNDGFANVPEMVAWFAKTHGEQAMTKPVNKLTLRKILQCA